MVLSLLLLCVAVMQQQADNKEHGSAVSLQQAAADHHLHLDSPAYFHHLLKE